VSSKLKLTFAAAALALGGCAFPTWTPDAAPVYTQPGNNPVTSPFASGPVSARDWACKCHCKSCFQ